MAKKTVKVHRGCGTTSFRLTDEFKHINSKYIGICLSCGIPITENEVVTREEYLAQSKMPTMIGGED